MAGFAGPNGIVDGLVLALDAGNTKSYPGSGTTWTDLSGNSNTGTLTNGPTYSSADGGSIVFDGTNDYVTVPANSDFSFGGTDDFTIELWMKTSTFSLDTYYRRVVSTGPDNSAAIQLLFLNTSSGSNSNISVRSNAQLINGTIAAATGDWVHVAVARIGSSMKLFVNGTQSGSTYTASSNYSAGASNGVVVGRYATLATGHFDGYISNLRIYKGKGLTGTEVTQNYNALKGRFGI